ncbi:hypothetical protein K488DRAFT_83218 [Vararia minispora EC-137]|uniref:Uncharacterized protein n=1 Tax=Vararia minispora EC-137 TaxID=1314806 RepID=A0ACB8QUF5_9AGAM|nr:hypothetical protein K488DRAFT_83218 [Vararia minispora EC-137]
MPGSEVENPLVLAAADLNDTPSSPLSPSRLCSDVFWNVTTESRLSVYPSATSPVSSDARDDVLQNMDEELSVIEEVLLPSFAEGVVTFADSRSSSYTDAQPFWVDVAQSRLAGSVPFTVQDLKQELLCIKSKLLPLFRAHRNAFLPIYRLPNEVLSRVFSWTSALSSRAVNINILSWVFAATCTCRRWRAVACADPALWRDIDARLGPEWVGQFFRRVRSIQVDFTVSDSKYAGIGVVVLEEFLNRIRSASLTSHRFALQAYLVALTASPAPHLQSIKLSCTPWDPHLRLPKGLDQNVPHLRSITLHGFIVPWTSLFFPELEELRVHSRSYQYSAAHVPYLRAERPSYTQFVALLRRHPRLRTLEILSCLPLKNDEILGPEGSDDGSDPTGGASDQNTSEGDGSNPTEANSTSGAAWTEQIVELPHLEHIFLEGTSMECAQALETLLLPPPCTLDIRSWHDRKRQPLLGYHDSLIEYVTTFVCRAHDVRPMQSFSLEMDFEETRTYTFRGSYSFIPDPEDDSLAGLSDSLFSMSIQMATGEREPAVKRVFDSLPLQDIRSLSICIWSQDNGQRDWVEYTNYCPKVEQLYLSGDCHQALTALLHRSHHEQPPHQPHVPSAFHPLSNLVYLCVDHYGLSELDSEDMFQGVLTQYLRHMKNNGHDIQTLVLHGNLADEDAMQEIATLVPRIILKHAGRVDQVILCDDGAVFFEKVRSTSLPGLHMYDQSDSDSEQEDGLGLKAGLELDTATEPDLEWDRYDGWDKDYRKKLAALIILVAHATAALRAKMS